MVSVPLVLCLCYSVVSEMVLKINIFSRYHMNTSARQEIILATNSDQRDLNMSNLLVIIG